MYKGTKRQKIWKHNSFLGHVSMAMSNMNAIAISETATPAAKQTAYIIWCELGKLKGQLKERVDAHAR